MPPSATRLPRHERALLVLTLALALLVPAATAIAGLPKPADPAVVVPTSLAGLKVGMPESNALSAWGGASRAKCSALGEIQALLLRPLLGDCGQGIRSFSFELAGDSQRVIAVILPDGLPG